MSPAAATTAEEAMGSSGDGAERAVSPRETTPSSGDTQHSASTGQEELAPEVEPWAAAVPPVMNLFGFFIISFPFHILGLNLSGFYL